MQADIFKMPINPRGFDRVFCFGVLQHTPAPHAAFVFLASAARPGGHLTVDSYKIGFFRSLLQTKYYVRPFVRKMDPERLYGLVTRWVDCMWPIAAIMRRLPKGYAINWRLLVADYSMLGLMGDKLKEWAYFDTFDMLAPHYDSPQTAGTVRQWFTEAGMTSVEVEYTPHGVVGRGVRPAS